MEPTLFEGDTIELLESSAEKLKAGSLYAYQEVATKAVAHRYLRKSGAAFVFQGDRQPYAETIASFEQIDEVIRVLHRYKSPEAEKIVLGLAKLIERDFEFTFPRCTTLDWPWDDIIQLAQKHALLGVIAYVLKKSQLWQEVPEDKRQVFQLILLECADRAQKISETKNRISGTLNIFRFLKGAAIAQKLYPDDAVRIMSDVDILVPYAEYQKSLQLLGANDFSLSASAAEISKFYHQTPLKDRATGITVEVHQTLFTPYRFHFNSEQFLCDSEIELEFIYLCAHTITHWGMHGQKLLDLYLYTQKQPLNWSRVTKLARENRVTLPVYFLLFVMEEWWNLDTKDYLSAAALTHSQRLRLTLAKFFYTHDLRMELFSRKKHILQLLLSDRIIYFLQLFLEPTRRKVQEID